MTAGIDRNSLSVRAQRSSRDGCLRVRRGGRLLGETCWHGGGAGRRPVWLGNGKVLMVDEEDGGELPLGHPSQHLKWLGQFPWWL
jgi:hypothetical protein